MTPVYIHCSANFIISVFLFPGAEQYLRDQRKQNSAEEESFGMMKTVIIAVCSAGAYLALVIGLTLYCSRRLMKGKKARKAREESENRE